MKREGISRKTRARLKEKWTVAMSWRTPARFLESLLSLRHKSLMRRMAELLLPSPAPRLPHPKRTNRRHSPRVHHRLQFRRSHHRLLNRPSSRSKRSTRSGSSKTLNEKCKKLKAIYKRKTKKFKDSRRWSPRRRNKANLLIRKWKK